MKNVKPVRFLLLAALLFGAANLRAQANQKQRVIILSDIEADPDDTQSFVRLFLYSNEIDIKGLVATTSCWHQNSVEPESIERVIQAYGKVHANLIQHDPAYPSEEELLNW